MKFLKIKVLSELLFRANSETKAKEFYAIKNDLLSRFGKPIGRDLQQIPGKICFHCNGTGNCQRWDCCSDWREDADRDCQRCWGDGWYKLPQNNVLLKVQFGKYVFHQPTERLADEEVGKYIYDSEIKTYIEHQPKKYGLLSLKILYWIYDRKAYKSLMQTKPKGSLEDIPF